MRIAFLTTDFVTESSFTGGLANYLFRICSILKSQGHDPTIFVAARKNEIFYYKGIRTIRVKSSCSLLVNMIDRLTFHRVSKIIDILSTSISLSRALLKDHSTKPFDVVQSSSYLSTNLFIKKIPSVVRISSYEPLWRKAYNKPLDIRQRFIEWMEITAIKKADKVYSPSKLLARIMHHDLNIDVSVIRPPFFLETEQWDWSLYNEKLMDKSYLLFVGTIGLMKGCKDIASIIKKLLSRNPGLHFVFIGNTTTYRGSSMMDYIWDKSAETRSRVIYISPLKHEKLYPIINKAKGIILPSLVDNFPNICLEAMSLGQIVVGTYGASFDELIEDDNSGFLCHPHDPESLLKSINKLLKLSTNERRLISEKAADVMRGFDHNEMTFRLVEFLKLTIDLKIQINKV